jgi:hypothetical protein
VGEELGAREEHRRRLPDPLRGIRLGQDVKEPDRRAAAPRVSSETGPRNSAAASASTISADVPPATGYVKSSPYAPRLIASVSLKRRIAVPGAIQKGETSGKPVGGPQS